MLRNHSQVALLAGRLSFFDLRDPMGAHDGRCRGSVAEVLRDFLAPLRTL